MESTKTSKLFLISFLLLILIFPLVFANKGGYSLGPPDIVVEESAQNAIVAWNGNEEVLILSTNVKSSESTLVLEFIPLPSTPSKVEEGSFESFTKIAELFNEKTEAEQYKTFGAMSAAKGDSRAPGVEVTFHKKVGAHDVTVVKVNDLDYFIDWIKDFTESKGFEYQELSYEFKETIASYLYRNINFFVFDVIEVDPSGKSIKPLVYRFESDFLYYPLEITSTSAFGNSDSEVSVFLIANGQIDTKITRHAKLYQDSRGYRKEIIFNGFELQEVSPEVASLFGGIFGSAHVMKVNYNGNLKYLNKDLVVEIQHIGNGQTESAGFFDLVYVLVGALVVVISIIFLILHYGLGLSLVNKK